MNIVDEIWKDISGYEGCYQVSNLGRVRSCDRYTSHKTGTQFVRGQLLKPWMNDKGYFYVQLHKDSKGKKEKVHRLVAFAFVDGFFEGSQVNHIDGVKINNQASNLEFCTASKNMYHSYSMGLQPVRNVKGERHPSAKLTTQDVLAIRERISNGDRRSDIAKDYPVTVDTIHSIAARHIWSHIP